MTAVGSVAKPWSAVSSKGSRNPSSIPALELRSTDCGADCSARQRAPDRGVCTDFRHSPTTDLTTTPISAALRDERKMTQPSLAEHVGVHVSQIRRYEAGDSSPTLDVLRKLAVALSVSADTLVFDENERGPDEDLRLQFEATTRLSDDEKHVVKAVIESILLSHEAKRWAA